MASIRPMVPQPSVTPTATVMPTTVSIPDGMMNLPFYFVKCTVALKEFLVAMHHTDVCGYISLN